PPPFLNEPATPEIYTHNYTRSLHDVVRSYAAWDDRWQASVGAFAGGNLTLERMITRLNDRHTC
ncbi:hypothetical protein, partial [Pseudomonas aeruginosa]|uniref:hypothetical protein n=1 Tax=Pseudomonas aeruginosa TaxID=287 RepID=UPI003523117F